MTPLAQYYVRQASGGGGGGRGDSGHSFSAGTVSAVFSADYGGPCDLYSGAVPSLDREALRTGGKID